MEKNLQQSKQKINLYLSIGIILVLIIGVVVLGKGGFNCQANPFLWGAQQMVKKETNDGSMECSCVIYDKYTKNYSMKRYSFNEKQENPLFITDPENPTMLLKPGTINLSFLEDNND